MTSMRKNTLGFALVVLAGLALVCGTAIAANAQNVRRVKHAPLGDTTTAGRMAILQEYLQYPPESTPIDGSYWDLIHPWSVSTTMHIMIPAQTIVQIQALEKSGLSQEQAVQQAQSLLPSSLPMYQFEMNKTILAGTQDQLQASLTINGASGFQVTKAEIIGSHLFGSPDLGAVPFSCDAASSVCTFQWHAPSADNKYWGSLSLQVTVTVDGFQTPFVLNEPFYSSPMVAGKFTGQFQDKIANGSLVIDAGVNVQKHMACFVSANLYSADGTPLQHAERRMLVDPSMNTISFTFFGKIFRDYGDQGTFRLQDLQARCQNLPYPAEWFVDQKAHQAEWTAFQKNPPAFNEPTRIYFEYNTYSYTTHNYALNTFSDAEWQSPAKTAMWAAYMKATANITGASAGTQ
jgi:hypothetical protein